MMADDSLKYALLGIRISLVSILFSLATTLLSFNYSSSPGWAKFLVNFFLILLCITLFYLIWKVKISSSPGSETGIKEEIISWGKLENLIELKKQQQHAFTKAYWSLGLLAVLDFTLLQIAWAVKESPWAFGIVALVVLLLFALIFAFYKVSNESKKESQDLEYLYRKKDGQKV